MQNSFSGAANGQANRPLMGLTKPACLTSCLLALCLAAIAVPACAEWQLLTQTPQAKHFYDDAVQPQGQQISVWQITDFIQPLTNLEGKEVQSEKTLATLDCASGKMAYSQVSRFSALQAQGEVMNHYETPLRFTRVAPGSPDALLIKKLCPAQ
jgi:hypothetical protein